MTIGGKLEIAYKSGSGPSLTNVLAQKILLIMTIMISISKKTFMKYIVFTPQTKFGGVHTDFTSQLIFFYYFQVHISRDILSI